MQYRLDHADLVLVLAVVRGGSLARAAALLEQDVSTVFRAIRRLEKALGSALFDKRRSGYLPTDAALRLAEQAEAAERALAAARLALARDEAVVSGTVRLTCTDSVLHGLLLPALRRFMPGYPALALALTTSNDFANLSRHDADLALRLTDHPPEHLVGRRLGTVDYLLCGHPAYLRASAGQPAEALSWIAPDDFLPDHPTVAWRRRAHPAVLPAYRCSTLLAAAGLARAGLGIAALPRFLLDGDDGLEALGDALPGCATGLWLLTRPDCRALRSVSTLFEELGRTIALPGGGSIRNAGGPAGAS